MVKKKKQIPKILRRVKAKKILKKLRQPVVEIKEHEPAEYVSRFFKEEWDETKRALFFK
jgi:intein-encoded DNA endonuclease-like protein